MKKIIREDPKLQLLLLSAVIVQILTCITAIGSYHPDQHFQIIEFSSLQLKNQSAAPQVWELAAHIRPTLQVYIFSAYYLTCQFFRITDPYAQLTIVRIFMGLALLTLFNAICIYYLKAFPRKVLYIVLLILNFSWLLPYTRTLFSSEMLSSFFFFGAVFLYDVKKSNARGIILPLLTGFLFSLSFYTRFQIGFAIAGFVVWMLWSEKKNMLPLAAGFLIGVLLNTSLDYWFYHKWVITPYNYYTENITNGKAAEFGTTSFLIYIGLLVAVVTTPPLSVILLYSGFKASLKMLRSPFVLPIFIFIIGHCMVGHKEERFFFPVLNILPLFIGWGLPGLVQYYRASKKWVVYLINGGLAFSVCLNVFLLVALIFTPYSQAIYFSYLLKKKFEASPAATIYCIRQSPFETPSGLQLEFYRKAIKNIELKKINTIDSLQLLKGNDIYVSATYDHTTDEEKSLLDRLGYKPVAYASKFLWNINRFLHSRNINTINDIWVLYKKE